MSARKPGDGLVHPVVVLAIGLLVLNDHVLKAIYPGHFITGKLSDVAGMIFFPLFLQAIFEVSYSIIRKKFVPSRTVLLASAAATGLVFSSIQLFDWAANIYRWGLGALQAPFRGQWLPVSHYMDPTDLIAVPAIGVAIWIAWPRTARQHPDV